MTKWLVGILGSVIAGLLIHRMTVSAGDQPATATGTSIIINNQQTQSNAQSLDGSKNPQTATESPVSKPVAEPRPTGNIVFYEGEAATQTQICSLPDSAGQVYNLTSRGTPCTNDEARSVVLNNITEGRKIYVSDRSDGSCNRDDCNHIVVKKYRQSIIVRSFEENYEDEFVSVTYTRDNGLNGKVSHIRID